MTWQTLWDPGTSGRVCMTLVHSIWQVTLLAAIAWACERLLRRRSVEWNYTLHVAAMVIALVALPVTYALVDAPRPAPAALAESPVDDANVPAGSAALSLPPVPSEIAMAHEATSIAASDPIAPAPPDVATTVDESSPAWLGVARWVVAAWAAGVALMLVRLLRGTWRANRLGATAERINDGPLADALRSLARRWSMRVVPALARAEGIVMPKVIGLLRPMILLPVSAIACLSPDELEMILAHELAHVRRHDMWVNLLQRVAEAVLFFNPPLWYLSRRISTLREYCCDELTCRATARTHDQAGDAETRTRYASALLRVVELVRTNPAARSRAGHARWSDAAALTAAGRSPSELRRRVARLFDEPLYEPVRLSRGGILTALALAAVLVAGPSAWQSAAEFAAAPPAPPATPATAASKPAEVKPNEAEPVELAVIVARHVLLLDGKEIVNWADVEGRIGAMPNPSRVRPAFYLTRGAYEAGMEETLRAQRWRLHQKFQFKGHSVGSLAPRADLRYDRIQSAKDLVPDASLCVQGRVVDAKGGPVAGAEVVLAAPVDKSLPYRAIDIYLVEGRVRNPLEEVLTHSDPQGNFSVYPAKGSDYYLIALHPKAGFALTRGSHLARGGDVRLLPWATLTSKIAQGDGQRQVASLATRVREVDGLPELSLNQYWSDLKREPANGEFRFTHVPAILDTTILRSFPSAHGGATSIPEAGVSLLPGEVRRLDMGPPSEKQREQLERIQKMFSKPPADSPAKPPAGSQAKPADRAEPVKRASEPALFEDNFAGKLSDKWEVVGLATTDYRIRDGGLELRVQPGAFTKSTPMLRVMLPFKSSDTVTASVRVTPLDEFTQDGEFAGVYLVDETGPEFGAKKQRVDNQLMFAPPQYEFRGKSGEEGDPKKYERRYTFATPEAGPLRIISDRGNAFFQVGPSADGKYLNYFHSAIRESSKRGFALVAAGGPDGTAHWVRFEAFRVDRNR